MSFKKLVVIFSSILFLALPSTALEGKNGPCGGQKIATPSHFTYSSLNPASATFAGLSGSQLATFDVTPPGGGTVFTTCNPTDTANIFVRDITQIGDANGNPLSSTVDITSTNPTLASQIAAAFSFSPNPATFTPGVPVTINVTIANPGVDPSAYGVYDVNIAAKDETPGSAGIGVASGSDFILHLIAAVCSDSVKPTVTITEPTSDQILGMIPVEVTANDPSANCGTGVASLSATVSSSGGAVSGLLLLDSSTNTGTFDQSFTVPAGTTVKGDATFTPTGGSGTGGTDGGTPFSALALGGIGNYTINAEAKDVIGNIGTATQNFNVTYDLSFNSSPGNAEGKINIKFTVKRSNIPPNDGAFMVDETVAVALRTASSASSSGPGDASTYGSLVHYFGCGDVKTQVQIKTSSGVSSCPTATAETYETHYDSGLTSGTAYYADVWFKDVDNVWRLEGTQAYTAP